MSNDVNTQIKENLLEEVESMTIMEFQDALDKAGQGKPLTPIQRKAMAQQAASVDQLAGDPKTATQFRNLLNKLNKGQ